MVLHPSAAKGFNKGCHRAVDDPDIVKGDDTPISNNPSTELGIPRARVIALR